MSMYTTLITNIKMKPKSPLPSSHTTKAIKYNYILFPVNDLPFMYLFPSSLFTTLLFFNGKHISNGGLSTNQSVKVLIITRYVLTEQTYVEDDLESSYLPTSLPILINDLIKTKGNS